MYLGPEYIPPVIQTIPNPEGSNIVGYKTTTQGIKPIYGIRGPQ